MLLEMTERHSGYSPSNGDGDGDGDVGKVHFLLRDIRDELRTNNQLLKEVKEGKSDPLRQQDRIDAAQ